MDSNKKSPRTRLAGRASVAAVDNEIDEAELNSASKGVLDTILSGVNTDPDDQDALYAGDPDDDIEALKLKDWDEVADEDLPILPGGYVFEWLKSEDGKEWHRRIILPAPARVLDDKFHDSLSLDEAAKNRGKFAQFDFAWGPKAEDHPSTREYYQTGFVPVNAKEFEDTVHMYPKENGKVINGDLVLMMRPKSVTEKRAREYAAYCARRMGQQLDTNKAELENIDNRGYGEIVDAETSLTQGGQQERQSLKQLRIAEQLEVQRNAQRGKVQFAGFNAPFQKTIQGGRVIHDPGATAAVGAPR